MICRLIFQEESGSESYMSYIDYLQDKIKNIDFVFCFDSGCLDYSTLFLTTNLRGFIEGTIKVRILE